MKKISFLIGLLLICIFTISIYSLFQSRIQFEKASLLSNEYSQDYSQKKERLDSLQMETVIRTRLSSYSSASQRYSEWIVWINLVITVIAGLSTLLTTISMIKNNGVSKKTAIVVAIFTFASSLLSFGLGQVNSSRQQIENHKEAVIKVRNNLRQLRPLTIDKWNADLDDIPK